MKTFALCSVLTVLSAVVATSPVAAETTHLQISFAGGCMSENTTGSCSIKTIASGTDLDAEKYVLYVSDGPKAPMRRASMHYASVSASGVGRSRLQNRPGGCFQMRTAPNGDDVPDVYSQVLCEK